jgi:acetylornithine deacetylase/succinyl-diaminopimelate desuccinylase family protein
MITQTRILELVTELVRIESINPRLAPGGSGEATIARHVLRLLSQAGLTTQLQESEPRRFNAVGILKGRGCGRTLMLNGHLDTVGIEGMEHPFSARIEGSRLYGRGAQDMKGGLAAALVAVEELARGPALNGDVIITAVADEEFESVGTHALLASGAMADAAIVLEPTDVEIATAHKGFAWAEITTQGRAAHGSRPEEGIDAIALMGRVLAELENLQHDLSARPGHPTLGHGSVHASVIAGGQELSSYPASCRLTLERRLIPGEDYTTVDLELSEMLARLARHDEKFSAWHKVGYWAHALETPAENALVQQLLACATTILGSRAKLGVQTFWTDGALLSEAGIPTVLFGPGGAGLHSTVEYVDLDDVLLCAQTLVEFTRVFCGSALS